MRFSFFRFPFKLKVQDAARQARNRDAALLSKQTAGAPRRGGRWRQGRVGFRHKYKYKRVYLSNVVLAFVFVRAFVLAFCLSPLPSCLPFAFASAFFLVRVRVLVLVLVLVLAFPRPPLPIALPCSFFFLLLYFMQHTTLFPVSCPQSLLPLQTNYPAPVWWPSLSSAS